MDPNQLREALDAEPGANQFSIGEMSDPSEVLLVFYECMAKVPFLVLPTGASGRNSMVPAVDFFFGLRLREELRCGACSVVSHRLASHVEYLIIISATTLRTLYREGEQGRGFSS